MFEMRTRFGAGLALIGLVAALAAVATITGGASGRDPTTDAVDSLPWRDWEDAQGKPAALVNGVPIELASVMMGVAMGGPGTTEGEVLEALIDRELLYQEAVALGYQAQTSEVAAYIEDARSTIPPELLDFLVQSANRMGLSVTELTYWEHPLVLGSTERQLTIGKYIGTFLQGAAGYEAEEAARASKVAELRSGADIRYVASE